MDNSVQQKEKTAKTKRPPGSGFGLGEKKEYFIENLSLLIDSGVGIVPALEAISQESSQSKMRRVIDFIVAEVEEGGALWQAMDKSRAFSSQAISLVKIGEDSGKLSDNLKVIALQQQKERVFRSKLRSAMLYPTIVVILILTVGTGVIWFILPKLSMVFSSLNLKLPAITKIMIGFGKFLNDWGLVAVPAFFVLIMLLFYLVFFFSKTKIIGEKILFIIPGIKRMLTEAEIARFGYILGTLVSTGMPVVGSLDSLAESTRTKRYRQFYLFVKESIDEGNSFQKSFVNYAGIKKLMPGEVRQIIATGEQSGNLSKVLLKIGEDYETRLDSTTKDLAVILEPILLILVWLGVATIAVSVIMPIYSLIGGLNSR